MNKTFEFGQFTPTVDGYLLPPIWMEEWDVFYGTFLDDTFYGRRGNDMMWGSVGADTFFGGAGSDTVNYSNAGPTNPDQSGEGVHVNLETGEGRSGLAKGDRYSSVENVIGTAFNDKIFGSAAKNKILTGEGRDWVHISDGSDYLDGGDDIDLLMLDGYNDVTIDLLNGRGIGGIADGDTYLNFENLQVRGDRNTVVGTDEDNRISIQGSEYSVDAQGGDDTIQVYQLTNRHIDGGSGVDQLLFSQFLQSAVFDLDQGEIRFVGASAGDPIATVAGIEQVYGTENADVFIDGRGDNFYHGRGGADTFVFDHDFSGERDVIEYFQTAAGYQIDLRQTNVRNYEDLMDGGSRRLEQMGNDAIIYTGNDNQIFLDFIFGPALTEDHFIF